MAQRRRIEKGDIELKARMLSEGVRVIKDGKLFSRPQVDESTVDLPDEIDSRDGEALVRLFAASNSVDYTDDALGNAIILDGSNIPAPMFPDDDSALTLEIEEDRAVISEAGRVLGTGTFFTPHRPWDDAVLSNGLPIKSFLPGMSSMIVNILFTISCNNYNTGKGCKYCGLFSNPFSKKVNQLPIESLKVWAKYQAEALKVLTDHGWRGTIALSGGALPPSQRSEYLSRLDASLSAIREILDDETFNSLNFVYNHYPPDDFKDMYRWKEMGVNGTSIDMEVVGDDKFAEICPGKHAYKPLSYWKEAMEASVEVFGPMLHTTTNIVLGLEPMEETLAGVDERLGKSVLVVPLTFIPDPGSAMADASPPPAEWLVQVSERIADLYVKHGLRFMASVMREVAPRLYQRYAPGFMKSERPPRPSLVGRGEIQLTHLAIVFDEVVRRAQKIPGLSKRLKVSAC